MSETLSKLKNDDIRFMLEAAIKAPSGDNDQPWLWKVHGDEVELWYTTKHDLSDWDLFRRATKICLGAAIENFCVAASTRGYRVEVTYFPESETSDHIATLHVVKDMTVTPDPLATVIDTRQTNRRPYNKKPLTQQEYLTLTSVANPDFGTAMYTCKPEEIKTLATAAVAHDEIIFSNKKLHAYFFNSLNWSKKQDDERRVGFYLPTFELPAPTRASLHLLKHWWAMRIGDLFRFHKLIAFTNRGTYTAAGAMGIIATNSMTPTDLLKAGRLIERIWLTATLQGLQMQPMTGAIFFKIALDNHDELFLTDRQTILVKHAYQAIEKTFTARGKNIIFMFRLGHAAPPSVRSLRLPLEQVVEVLE